VPSLPAPLVSRLAGALAAAAMTAITPLEMHSALAAAPPSVEAQATLKKAFTAAQSGLSSADGLLSSSISTWESTGQPAEETAELYKARGGLRSQEGKLPEARDDLSKALSLMQAPGSKPELAEVQRTFQLRARVNGLLGNRLEQVEDLSAAIARLDDLDVIEATNPYVYAERAKARMAVGEFRGAAEDSETAEMLFKDTGDKIRRTLAAADGALASYGAGDVQGGVEKMRYVFRTKRDNLLASNNPDDIALLQELSKKDAELHIAYAAHLYATQQKVVMAAQQWESGCVRLSTYVVDGTQRFEEERKLREKEAAGMDATGQIRDLRAASVSTPFGIGDQLGDLSARLNGLDPDNPYVTQRAGRSYFWYKTSEGEVERRDAGNPLQDREDDIAIGLSCTAFQDPAWVAKNRPEWPKNLVDELKLFAAEVKQPDYPLPPKGTPPTKGELQF